MLFSIILIMLSVVEYSATMLIPVVALLIVAPHTESIGVVLTTGSTVSLGLCIAVHMLGVEYLQSQP